MDSAYTPSATEVIFRYQDVNHYGSCRFMNWEGTRLQLLDVDKGMIAETAFPAVIGSWYTVRATIRGNTATCEVVGFPETRISGAYNTTASGTVALRSVHIPAAFDDVSVTMTPSSTADFNRDGTADVIWQDPVTGWAQVWYLGGAQGVSITGAANLTARNTWRIVGVADFDRDGHPDVVWQDPDTGAAQLWLMGGEGGNVIASATTLSAANTWRIMSVADFNKDGVPDCIWQDQESGWAQIWFMGGAQGTTLTGAVNLTTRNTWRIGGTGDFNADGVPDVVWQDPATGATQIWYLGGAQGNELQSAANLAGASDWRIAAIADFNNDSHPDIAWQDPASGASAVWFLGGAQGVTVTGSAAMGGPNTWRIMGPR
jgi:hypothetical protein